MREFFTKRFFRSDLLCTEIELTLRLDLIQKASRSLEFIPNIQFTYEEGVIIYKQKFIEGDNRFTSNSFYEFANNLNTMYRLGLIHADIHKRNIIIDKGRVYLIDFEPSMVQLKFNKKIVKSKNRSSVDRKNNTVTSLTDVKGYYNVCKYYLNSETYLSDEKLASMSFLDVHKVLTT